MLFLLFKDRSQQKKPNGAARAAPFYVSGDLYLFGHLAGIHLYSPVQSAYKIIASMQYTVQVVPRIYLRLTATELALLESAFIQHYDFEVQDSVAANGWFSNAVTRHEFARMPVEETELALGIREVGLMMKALEPVRDPAAAELSQMLLESFKAARDLADHVNDNKTAETTI